MGPYRDSISLKKSPLLGLYTGSEAQLDLATVRYHALGAYAKSVYLVFFGHFPIEIPMYLQICIFRPQGVLKSKSWRKQTQLKIQFYIEKHVGQLF